MRWMVAPEVLVRIYMHNGVVLYRESAVCGRFISINFDFIFTPFPVPNAGHSAMP